MTDVLLCLPLCFPSFATVYTRHGPKNVIELQIGEEVKVMMHDNTLGYSPVIGWAHNDPAQDADFLELSTASERSITLSKDHLLPIVRGGASRHHHSLRHHEIEGVEYVKAGKIVDGDCVLQLTSDPAGESERFHCVVVTGRQTIRSRGIFAPLTMVGTVVVDNTAASCYAAVSSHAGAHAALAPVRAAFELSPEFVAKHHKEQEGKKFTGALNYVDRLGRLKMRAHNARSA